MRWPSVAEIRDSDEVVTARRSLGSFLGPGKCNKFSVQMVV